MGLLIAIANYAKAIFTSLNNVRKTAQNAIKNGIKASQIYQNPLIIFYLIFEQIKAIILSIIKGFAFYLVLIILIVALVVGTVNTVIDIVMSPIRAVTGLFKTDAKTYAENITEEELAELERDGMSLHPFKLKEYIIMEEKSVPKNTIVQRKVWNRTLNSKSNDWLGTSSEPTMYDHDFNIEDTAYPYRLFFEALTGIDIINETAAIPNEKEILNRAGKKVTDGGLESIYDWSFDYSIEYTEDGKHYVNIDYDSFQYEETIWDSTYTKTETYKNGSLQSSNEHQEDFRYSYPLPYLNSVKTMFKDYNFEYEKVVLEDDGWINNSTYPVTESWSETYWVSTGTDEEGNETGYYETDHYTQYTYIQTRKKVEKDLPLPYTAINNDNFVNFLDKYNIDVEVDAHLILEIAQQFPESQHFSMLLREVIDDAYYSLEFSDIDINIDPTDNNWLLKVPQIFQYDTRWANLPYGREGTIKSSACGPTSMAIVIQSFRNTGKHLNVSTIDLDGDGILNPYEIAQWSLNKGHRVYGAGTSWTFFNSIGNEVGLNVHQVGKTQIGGQTVLNALSQGKLVVASMGPGEFTRGGHYIVLAGIDNNGRITVRDPNSQSRSNKTYNFSNPIFSQAKQFWIVSD